MGRESKPKGKVCTVLRAEARPGDDADLEAVLNDLAYHVRAEEIGCESYVVTRMMGSREHFAVHVRFSDWASFEAHAETQHLTRIMPRVSALLATPITMEIFVET